MVDGSYYVIYRESEKFVYKLGSLISGELFKNLERTRRRQNGDSFSFGRDDLGAAVSSV